MASDRRVYLDTNVFIRAFEGEEEEARPLRRLFETLRVDGKRAVTSELALAEVLAPAKRKGALELQIKRRLYLNLIVWSGFIDLQPVSRSILVETADLRSVAPHKLPDAIHLVTAIRSGCSFFMWNDRKLKAPDGMQFILPGGSGVETVIDALRD